MSILLVVHTIYGYVPCIAIDKVLVEKRKEIEKMAREKKSKL